MRSNLSLGKKAKGWKENASELFTMRKKKCRRQALPLLESIK